MIMFNMNDLSVGESILVSLLAMLIVFFVLFLLIVVNSVIEKGIKFVDSKTKINPKPENKILEEDEDAVVATLVATIDYHKEFNKDCKVVSIEKIDEE